MVTSVDIADLKIFNMKMIAGIRGSLIPPAVKKALAKEIIDNIHMPLILYCRKSNAEIKAAYKGMVVARLDKVVNELGIADVLKIDDYKKVVKNVEL